MLIGENPTLKQNLLSEKLMLKSGERGKSHRWIAARVTSTVEATIDVSCHTNFSVRFSEVLLSPLIFLFFSFHFIFPIFPRWCFPIACRFSSSFDLSLNLSLYTPRYPPPLIILRWPSYHWECLHLGASDAIRMFQNTHSGNEMSFAK